MSEETILTAARRVVRCVRVDNEAHGGLLSRETTSAVEILDRMLAHEKADGHNPLELENKRLLQNIDEHVRENMALRRRLDEIESSHSLR